MSLSTSIEAMEAQPRTPAAHFRLRFLAAVLYVVDQLSHNLGSLDDVVEQFPFVRDYLDATAGAGAAAWLDALSRWEASAEGHLPLSALRDALALDDSALTLLFAIGLIEEDPRFGFLIECAQPVAPQQQRPSLGLLTAWWRDGNGVGGVRERIRILLDSGLIQVLNADAPRLQWVFQSPPAVWDALRGEMGPNPTPWLRFAAPAELPRLAELVLDAGVRRAVDAVPSLLRNGELNAFIVRGPQHNGRRSIVRAVAREIGRGVLELRGPLRADDERWPLVGALSTLAHAVPLVVLDLALGETASIPPLRGFDGPLAVVMGKHGAVSGDAVDGAVTIAADVPAVGERTELWRQSLSDDGDAHDLARRFRMTAGNIRRAAALARSYARLDERRRIAPDDVRLAGRSLHRELETLATLVPAGGGWECVGTSAATLDELRTLESRCRHREALRARAGEMAGAQLNCGVRALFTGPSGTGKTMAARILAATLQLDLYRLDLASVVNKYIGETEKNLHQLFSRAEELDVVLLIDEGDALLTSRTAVQSSNDRYANLETNFLLQRLESFEGVLIVTTNGASRIDPAFQRRMDVVVDFRMPDANERWTIWQIHLPPGHAVDYGWLHDAALRCDVSGGQIRNAVLHASLLAVAEARPLSTGDLAEGLHREYRKAGAVCPMPRES